jgi:transcriptional regulator with XRE-family HTH domain
MVIYTENSAATQRLGLRVRAVRLRSKMSQTDFAKRAGISRGYLSDIENGHRVMSLGTLARIARTCGISADRMLGLRGAR